ncbi:hypothetical protein ACFOY2_47570 [Nonomuraea purpurea]|uniref:Uncharacterized protein n=1 Tax=Nonomuraea purpurea TaxID=1849276 RepID=A0ABV8GRI7_9ACTN
MQIDYLVAETLAVPARRHGLMATFMDDRERMPPKQSKIRITRQSFI